MTRAPEPALALTTIQHRIAFFETDAMGIVHHSNYVRFLEIARVRWMEEHHRPYGDYMAAERHFAVTHVSVDYLRVMRFDEALEVTAGLEWIRGASLRMAYRLSGPDGDVAAGATEHAMVDDEGRVRRIPRTDREHMATLVAPPELWGVPSRRN